MNKGPVLVNMCALCALSVGFPATLALLTTLAPGYIGRARAVARKRPGQSFLLGLGNFAFFFLIPLVVLGLESLGINLADFVLVLSCVPMTILLPPFMTVGFTIAAIIVGEQFLSQTVNRPGSQMGSLAVGALLCVLAALVPIVGWTLLLILVLGGMGAAVIAFVQQTRQPSLAEDDELEI